MRDLIGLRTWFAAQKAEAYVDTVFALAGVHSAIMTNDPFDDAERPIWEAGRAHRAVPVGAVDRPAAQRLGEREPCLSGWGYAVHGSLGRSDIAAVQRFLTDWIAHPPAVHGRLAPADVRVSRRFAAVDADRILHPARRPPGGHSVRHDDRREAQREPATAAGRRRRAGEQHGRDQPALCSGYPDNRFLLTTLAREDQHGVCVTARKHPNLHPFGCWWFLNNPSIIEEMTRQRFELLGLSVTPQHSDARVLDQIVYKWTHWRRILAKVLTDKYRDLLATGWAVTPEEIRRDVADLSGGAFERFCTARKQRDTDGGSFGQELNRESTKGRKRENEKVRVSTGEQ